MVIKYLMVYHISEFSLVGLLKEEKSYGGMKIDLSFWQPKKEEADIVVMDVGKNTLLVSVARANENLKEDNIFLIINDELKKRKKRLISV